VFVFQRFYVVNRKRKLYYAALEYTPEYRTDKPITIDPIKRHDYRSRALYSREGVRSIIVPFVTRKLILNRAHDDVGVVDKPVKKRSVRRAR